ncbi:hypothetical protein N657DRAFT_674238 [Parathielavia appendiculata]|uniref:Uncharacterized protein n=1 Tax=Parathielavia appendiculata TaxID=2587402 RepID=A0AAN6TTS5_9PEZI|nr:hypothetical protein N657DRAFT_674238 [Parathielavia appendiculata]
MDNSVYLGAWTNWEYGKVHGLTLTLDQPWRDVLIAAIALVITFTGTQIWGVICFLAFRFRQLATGDHIYHYVQATLRNSSSSPTSFALRLIEIAWSQRPHDLTAASSAATGLMQDFSGAANADPKHPQHSVGVRQTKQRIPGAFGATLVRLSSLLALAVGFSAGFTAISLLGVQFFKAADDSALITSPYCGWPAEVSDTTDRSTPEAREASFLLMVPSRAQYKGARAYARGCYAETADGEVAKQCDASVAPRIASTLTVDETCPFPGAGVCKTGSVSIESARIDSRSTLGINTPDEDRVAVKKSLTCAPINADQWATGWIDGAEFGYVGGDRIQGYAVGTVPDEQPPKSEYPFVATTYSERFATSPYPLTWRVNMPGNDSALVSTFRPRDELKVEDADLTLIALTAAVIFDQEVPDPWFNITVRQRGGLSGGDAWAAPWGFSILGCLESYQFCAAGFCSQPGALYQLRASPTYGLRSLNPRQKAVADLVWKSLWAAQLQYAMIFMANEILVANELVMGNWYFRSSSMPSDQWTVEAWNFANISFAALQRRPGDYASPAAVLREDPSRIVSPDTGEARELCRQIRVRTTKYTSFRVLSLALLAGVTVIMAALNGILPYYFSKTSNRGGGKHEATEWDGYGIFHLIRSVCEARGIGTWDRREETVPVMREKDRQFSLHAGFEYAC